MFGQAVTGCVTDMSFRATCWQLGFLYYTATYIIKEKGIVRYLVTVSPTGKIVSCMPKANCFVVIRGESGSATAMDVMDHKVVTKESVLS